MSDENSFEREDATMYMRMYKCGFIDGFRCKRQHLEKMSEVKLFNKIKLHCMKAFSARFSKKIAEAHDEREKDKDA